MMQDALVLRFRMSQYVKLKKKMLCTYIRDAKDNIRLVNIFLIFFILFGLISKLIIAIVFEGFGVISQVRKILGSASPADGDIGTIRDDYSLDTYALADSIDRSTMTMLHASDSVENAERELKIWFKESEICNNYETGVEKIFYDAEWSKGK